MLTRLLSPMYRVPMYRAGYGNADEHCSTYDQDSNCVQRPSYERETAVTTIWWVIAHAIGAMECHDDQLRFPEWR
jgi:hypothetical protein